MKLRNKYTNKIYTVGENLDIRCTKGGWIEVEIPYSYLPIVYIYDSLTKFCKDWEDYTPKEPLIKDEKIRNALRASYDAAPYRDNVVYFDGRWTFRGDKFEVMFDDRDIEIEGWTEGKVYHIEELCGEEEE